MVMMLCTHASTPTPALLKAILFLLFALPSEIPFEEKIATTFQKCLITTGLFELSYHFQLEDSKLL